MSTEEERLAKAKRKLLDMNKKVQRAKIISEKHQVGQNKNEAEPQEIKPKKKTESSDYLFELTEGMINIGFSEEEVTNYIEKVEKLSKISDSELEKQEKNIHKDIKKINKSIQFLKDPKSAEVASETASVKSEISVKDSSPDTLPPLKQGPRYSDMIKGRQSPMIQRNLPSLISPKETNVSKTPSKIPKPPKNKPKDADMVQATGAGAQFLASLADDL